MGRCSLFVDRGTLIVGRGWSGKLLPLVENPRNEDAVSAHPINDREREARQHQFPMRGSQAALAKRWGRFEQERPLFNMRDDRVRGNLIVPRNIVFDFQQVPSRTPGPLKLLFSPCRHAWPAA